MSQPQQEMLNPILCVKNLHPRDLNIKFEEEGHKYTIFEENKNKNENEENQKKYTSVTTWVHSHFPHFNADEIIKKMMSGKSWKQGHKYWGLTAEQIKDLWNSKRDNAAGAGTNMHFEIECFMNSKVLLFDYTHIELYQQYKMLEKYDKRYMELGLEWKFFLKFVEDFPNLKPYRTEWTVYDEELKLAGSIDMVYENPDGTLSIYDWKRATEINRFNTWNKYAITECVNHIPDSNYWHYTFQLNAYKAILERKYDKVVKDLYLVRLHPDCEDKTYELIKLPDLKKDINQLFELLKVN
jgi:ATP-dependent exoDNAse (exonuclease V) beta subunit